MNAIFEVTSCGRRFTAQEVELMKFVPWDQIVAERSHTWRDQPFVEIAAEGCRTCGSLPDQQCGDAPASCNA